MAVLNHEDNKNPREKLVEDLITVVSHFAGKLYSTRAHKYEKMVEGARKLIEDQELLRMYSILIRDGGARKLATWYTKTL